MYVWTASRRALNLLTFSQANDAPQPEGNVMGMNLLATSHRKVEN